MALRTIRIQGDPVIDQKMQRDYRDYTEDQRTGRDMLDTMYEANGVDLQVRRSAC